MDYDAARTAYEAKRLGDKMPDYVPMTVTDRGCTAIWHTPEK